MNTNQRAINAYCGMMNKTFENIVGKVFINSIPISRDELTPGVRKELTKYDASVDEQRTTYAQIVKDYPDFAKVDVNNVYTYTDDDGNIQFTDPLFRLWIKRIDIL